MLNASGVDDAIDTDLVRPAPMMGETGNSLRRVATAVAATLALVGAEVAQADIVVLPT